VPGPGGQFVVPLGLESIGDKTIRRIDQHEATLRQICFELRTLDSAVAQPVGFFLSGFDLSPDLER
jgi:hypothetical protein